MGIKKFLTKFNPLAKNSKYRSLILDNNNFPGKKGLKQLKRTIFKGPSPKTSLVVPKTDISQPKFPVFDAHNHLEEFGGMWFKRDVKEILDVLDSAGITHYLDLDGGWGESTLQTHLDKLKGASERFLVYGGVNWNQWQAMGDSFPEWAASRLREQKKWGADGLKIWKPLGLQVRDHKNLLVRVDDPRLDPIWQTAAELGLPVMIHVADPVAFFEPIDQDNERWDELKAYPEWAFPSPPYPSFNDIIEGLANLVSNHPNTTFIGAHMGCYAENLAWVGALLDRCPNLFVDTSQRIGELGRQPYTARKFFLRYADRILFGLDLGPNLPAYKIAYRFFETEDEYFNYHTGVLPNQGRWYVYGLHLPDDVLKQIYYQNAERILLA
jgi:predicted TIM-barrel fold metal-dependent hydrolase